MAETTTTTTTAADEQEQRKGVQNTTTTTTEAVKTDPAPTGKNASVNHPGGDASPMAERQGEVAIDKGQKTDVVGGFGKAADVDAEKEQSDLNRENAKQDALRNHAREQSEQPR